MKRLTMQVLQYVVDTPEICSITTPLRKPLRYTDEIFRWRTGNKGKVFGDNYANGIEPLRARRNV